jgi:hypothetical protein
MNEIQKLYDMVVASEKVILSSNDPSNDIQHQHMLIRRQIMNLAVILGVDLKNLKR